MLVVCLGIALEDVCLLLCHLSNTVLFLLPV